MLPVVTGRFLFSQAPDLLLPMWKQGQLQPGWLPAGCPDSAQRGLSGLATPGPRLISGWPELPPTLGPHFSHPQQLCQEEGAMQGCHSRPSRWPKRSEAQG